MAVLTEQHTATAPRTLSLPVRLRPLSLTLLLTLWCLLIGGYHPYAEDGGIYLSGIQWLLHPHLYPAYNGFVSAHLKLSLFPWLVVLIVRATHLPLMGVMFLLHAFSIWLTLFAGWVLADRCYPANSQRPGAVLLLAAGLTLPVAGTSLMLMDPYVTARSFSAPLGMFALAAAIDIFRPKSNRRSKLAPLVRCMMLLACSAAIHPLMSVYTIFCVLLLVTLLMERGQRWTVSLVLGALLLAFSMSHWSNPASHAYLQAAQTRTYWFPAMWRWFEWLGVFAPLALFCYAIADRRNRTSPIRSLATMAAVAITTCLLVVLLFAHVSSRSMFVASLQPLRQLHLLYCLMFLGLGATLDSRMRASRTWAWPALLILSGVGLCVVQRQTFPSSQHLELPGGDSRNGWQQAFLWIRSNTPTDAVFALDSAYTSAPGEDTQNFKAMAERSSLPDYSKDGGIASIAPELAEEWANAQAQGANLGNISDVERVQRFRRTAIGWIVLPTSAATHLACPYANATIRVCRLR